MKSFVSICLSYLHTPYIWGGQSFYAFDCNGFVQDVLKCYGMDPPGDQTAQGYYNHFSKPGNYISTKPQMGALVFYKKESGRIYHVALMIDKYKIIEAAGGDQTTTTIHHAKKRNAKVRVRPFNTSTFRRNGAGVFMPDYVNVEPLQ